MASMWVTVNVLGDEEREVDVTGGTYGDVLESVGLSSQEATVLVDGRPVPADQPIEAAEVQVLRLVRGG